MKKAWGMAVSCMLVIPNVDSFLFNSQVLVSRTPHLVQHNLLATKNEEDLQRYKLESQNDLRRGSGSKHLISDGLGNNNESSLSGSLKGAKYSLVEEKKTWMMSQHITEDGTEAAHCNNRSVLQLGQEGRFSMGWIGGIMISMAICLVIMQNLDWSVDISAVESFATKSPSDVSTGDLSVAAGQITSPSLPVWVSALGGAAAGTLRGATRLVTFPLDTVKARQQVAGAAAAAAAAAGEGGGEGTAAPAAGGAPRPQLDSPAKLFNGCIPAILAVLPSNAVFFATYDVLESVFASHPSWGISSMARHLLSSAIATLPSNAIKIPAEVVKQRCQVEPGSNSLVQARSVWTGGEGLWGFYAGGQAQLAREIPFNALQFLVFETLTKESTLLQNVLPQPLLGYSAAVGGFIASGAACIATQPIDTVKTRLMTQRARLDPGRGERTLLGCGRLLLLEGGPAALYAGWAPRLALVSVGGAAYFWADRLVTTLLLAGGGAAS